MPRQCGRVRQWPCTCLGDPQDVFQDPLMIQSPRSGLDRSAEVFSSLTVSNSIFVLNEGGYFDLKLFIKDLCLDLNRNVTYCPNIGVCYNSFTNLTG